MGNDATRRKALGLHIRKLREFAGLSQARVAELLRAEGLDTNRQSVNGWETGAHAPAGDSLVVLERVLREAAEKRERPPGLLGR